MSVEKTVSDVLRVARELRPDLWERSEAVAKIIDPGAFATDWIIEPAEAAEMHRLRLELLKANAMCKAQEILRYLGVNTDADWYEILTRLAKERANGSHCAEAL